MSYKPGGFVQGAGHGGTFEDAYGKLLACGYLHAFFEI